MGRSPCCAKVGMNKGAWSAIEDRTLSDFIKNHGEGKWRTLPKKAGLNRCGKSCRLRWMNYLRPDIKRGNISPDEEDLIIRLHKLLGNRWSLIARRLPGRTDNEIKNYWNTHLGKRVHEARQNIRNTRVHEASVDVVRTKAMKCARAIVTDPATSNVNQNDPNYGWSPSSSPSLLINATAHDSTYLLGGGSTGGASNVSDFLMDSDIFGVLDFDTEYRNNIAGDENNLSIVDPFDSHMESFTSLLDFGWILGSIDEGDETKY